MADYRLGTDVSDFQSVDAWDRMVAEGVTFAWSKQNQGSFECQTAVTHRQAAAARGVPIDGYSWAVFNADPTAAAQTFSRLLQSGPRSLQPCWDVEDVYGNGSPTGASNAQRSDWLETALDVTEAEMGVKPMIYTGGWYWDPYMEPRARFAEHMLWLASYIGGSLPNYMPQPISPWGDVGVWQYAGDVAAFGLDSTDLDVTTSDTLAILSGGTPSQGGLSMADVTTVLSAVAQSSKDTETRFNGLRLEVAQMFHEVNQRLDLIGKEVHADYMTDLIDLSNNPTWTAKQPGGK